MHRVTDALELVDSQLAGSQDLNIAVVEYPPKKGLAHFDIVDFLQRGIDHVLVDHAGNLDHAPVGDNILAVVPDQDITQHAKNWEER